MTIYFRCIHTQSVFTLNPKTFCTPLHTKPLSAEAGVSSLRCEAATQVEQNKVVSNSASNDWTLESEQRIFESARTAAAEVLDGDLGRSL